MMSGGWGEGITCSSKGYQGSPVDEEEDMSKENADRINNHTDTLERNAYHPSIVKEWKEDEGEGEGEDKMWMAGVRREPLRSCIMSTAASERNLKSPRFQVNEKASNAHSKREGGYTSLPSRYKEREEGYAAAPREGEGSLTSRNVILAAVSGGRDGEGQIELHVSSHSHHSSSHRSSSHRCDYEYEGEEGQHEHSSVGGGLAMGVADQGTPHAPESEHIYNCNADGQSPADHPNANPAAHRTHQPSLNRPSAGASQSLAGQRCSFQRSGEKAQQRACGGALEGFGCLREGPRGLWRQSSCCAAEASSPLSARHSAPNLPAPQPARPAATPTVAIAAAAAAAAAAAGAAQTAPAASAGKAGGAGAACGMGLGVRLTSAGSVAAAAGPCAGLSGGGRGEGREASASVALEYRRVYPLEDSAESGVWSYLTVRAKVVEIVLCLITLWTLWLSPFLAAFLPVYSICYSLLYADIGLDVLYLLGVILEFNISFVDPIKRSEIQQRASVFSHKLSSPTLYLDLLSCALSYILVLPFDCSAGLRLVLMMGKYTRSHRLLWWPHCIERIRRLPLFQVTWLIVILVLVNHIVGCIYFMIVRAQGLWERHIALLDPPVDEYAFSYTYGINMIHAQVAKADILSVEELILYCIVAPLGTLISAMAFGEITILYQRLNLLEGQHLDDVSFSAEAMRILRVPQEMQYRVNQYFRYVHSSRDTFALCKLMSSLNEPLLEELKLHLYKGLVNKAKFFKHCDPEFTKHVVMRLEDKIYSPGDYIIRAGQEGDCMFFIIKGTVQVLSTEGEVLMSKSGGDYFGELALLTVGTKRSATVRAQTFTALARLSAEHFDEVLVRFPHELRNAFRGFNLMDGADLDSAFEQAQRRIQYRYKLLRGSDPPDMQMPIMRS